MRSVPSSISRVSATLHIGDLSPGAQEAVIVCLERMTNNRHIGGWDESSVYRTFWFAEGFSDFERHDLEVQLWKAAGEHFAIETSVSSYSLYSNSGTYSSDIGDYNRRVLFQFEEGDRVELHPGCDLWMRGARFGNVVEKLSGNDYSVKLDKLKQAVTFPGDRLMPAK